MSTARRQIRLGTSVFVAVRDPENPLAAKADLANRLLTEAGAGVGTEIASCVCYMIDRKKITTIRQDTAAGGNEVYFHKPELFEAGSGIIIRDWLGHEVDVILNQLKPDGALRLNTALTNGTRAGQSVKGRTLKVQMPMFGTPTQGSKDWGFGGAMRPDYARHFHGMEVDFEIQFTGDPGDGDNMPLNRKIVIPATLTDW